jgi:hypothetical protein
MKWWCDGFFVANKCVFNTLASRNTAFTKLAVKGFKNSLFLYYEYYWGRKQNAFIKINFLSD